MTGTVVTGRGHIYTFKDAEWLDRQLQTADYDGAEPFALSWVSEDSERSGGTRWLNILFVHEIERVAIQEPVSS